MNDEAGLYRPTRLLRRFLKGHSGSSFVAFCNAPRACFAVVCNAPQTCFVIFCNVPRACFVVFDNASRGIAENDEASQRGIARRSKSPRCIAKNNEARARVALQKTTKLECEWHFRKRRRARSNASKHLINNADQQCRSRGSCKEPT